MNTAGIFLEAAASLVILSGCGPFPTTTPTVTLTSVPAATTTPPAEVTESVTLTPTTIPFDPDLQEATDLFLPDGAQGWHVANGFIGQATFSPSGNVLAISSEEGILLYDANNLAFRKSLQSSDGIGAIAWSPDGKLLAGETADGTVVVWDVTTSERVVNLVTDIDPENQGLAWSPDGAHLARAGGLKPQRGKIYIWDTSTWQEAPTPDVSRDEYTAVAWSPDGQILAGSAVHAHTMLWDGKSGAILREFRAPEVYNSVGLWSHCLMWSPDGQKLAVGFGSGGDGSKIVIYDSASGDKLNTISFDPTGWDVEDLAWSPDGKLLAGGTTDLTIWNSSTWEKMAMIPDLQFSTLSWSQNGRMLATTIIKDQKRYLVIWDTSELQ